MLGHYPESGRHFFGALPQGWENDLALISQPLDFYAQNIYNGRFFRAADNAKGYEEVPGTIGRTANGHRLDDSPGCALLGAEIPL